MSQKYGKLEIPKIISSNIFFWKIFRNSFINVILIKLTYLLTKITSQSQVLNHSSHDVLVLEYVPSAEHE